MDPTTLLELLRLEPTPNHLAVVNDWLVAAGYVEAPAEVPADDEPTVSGGEVTSTPSSGEEVPPAGESTGTGVAASDPATEVPVPVDTPPVPPVLPTA